MSRHDAATIFPALFPFLFVGMWLAITTMLGLMSGWFGLQARFPDRKEQSVLTLRFKSGIMGLGVSFDGCLTLSACPSGLRIACWRIFGPFERPFLVPWEQIRPENSSSFFVPMTKLRFGQSEDVGSLKIDAGVWRKLSSVARTSGSDAPAPLAISSRGVAIKFAVQWAILTGGATAIFFFMSTRAGVPLLSCFGFPAVMLGVPQLIRYWRQRS